MFKKFCCSQNIRSLYDPTAIPGPLHALVEQYLKTYASDTRGSRLSDVFSESETFGMLEKDRTWSAEDFSTLDTSEYRLLDRWAKKNHRGTVTPRTIVRRKEIFRFGQRYTNHDSHFDDSMVICHTGNGDGDIQSIQDGSWVAGSIVSIFSEAKVGGPTLKTWVILQPYDALSDEDAVHDAYRRYPVAGGWLFSNCWSKKLVVVEATKIICHFASAAINIDGIESTCRLCIPLNKAGHSSPLISYRFLTTLECRYDARCKLDGSTRTH